ncbi:hypothetical protein N2152v2_007730 [Parachlorella kessleri]
MTMTTAVVALRRPTASLNSRFPARKIGALRLRTFGRTVKAEAKQDFDFDTFLMETANKFEQAENKPAIIGWGVAAAAAILTAEWLIHLPVFNVLLGFPIQLVGLLALPYLGIKYYVEGEDPKRDAEGVLKKVTNQLPGLGKK